MIKKYFLFLSILIFLLLVHFNLVITNHIGEKLFLTLHQNELAIKVLELPKDKDAKTYFLLGRLYFVENDVYKSIKYFTKSIEINPNVKEVYYGRGLSYGFASPIFYNDAEKDFKKYIEIDNQEYEKSGRHAYGAWAGYNDLSWIYFLQGEFDQAEKVSIEGMKISGMNPWLYNMLGVLALEKGNCADATIYFNNAEDILKSISSENFGEAYSGDSPDFWAIGKAQMEKTIRDNQGACSTFPQQATTTREKI